MAPKTLPSVPRVAGKKPMPWNKDVSVERFGRFQSAEPVTGVAIGQIRKLVEVEHLAEIRVRSAGTKTMLSPRVCARPRWRIWISLPPT